MLDLVPTQDNSQLPVASTCTNTLTLPRYSNADILRQKLEYAIEHTKGFYNV